MLGAIVSIGTFLVTSVVGTIVWGVRLEGRVNAAEQRTQDLKELILSKLDDIIRRQGSIERSLNGHFHPND